MDRFQPPGEDIKWLPKVIVPERMRNLKNVIFYPAAFTAPLPMPWPNHVGMDADPVNLVFKGLKYLWRIMPEAHRHQLVRRFVRDSEAAIP